MPNAFPSSLKRVTDNTGEQAKERDYGPWGTIFMTWIIEATGAFNGGVYLSLRSLSTAYMELTNIAALEM